MVKAANASADHSDLDTLDEIINAVTATFVKHDKMGHAVGVGMEPIAPLMQVQS
jgi:hypothetical protein